MHSGIGSFSICAMPNLAVRQCYEMQGSCVEAGFTLKHQVVRLLDG